MTRLLRAFLGTLCTLWTVTGAGLALAQDAGSEPATTQPTTHLSQFGAGAGPASVGGLYRLLDRSGTPGQSNAIAFDRLREGAFETTSLTCRLRVLEGGDGGAILFLNTGEQGVRGPAPFLKSWVEPNLTATFAVGIDVHNPRDEEMFSSRGNYRGMPEREVSLHWDGREIVKRMAPAEFRGDWADCEITVRHVIGGAEVTVQLGPERVYDGYFVPGLLPYESRLAIGAGTRLDASTEFDVKDILFERTGPARARRAPKHFQIFNHVLTDNSKTAYEAEVELPPANWEFGRVIMTVEIHDAGPDWDEWDRNGEVSIFDDDGKKWGLVPFITSYRTKCHWEVDVTHFRPWLAGKRRFEVRAGTTFYKNRGYLMSVSLDFHHGRPDLEPYRVDPIWVGTARYRSAENHFQDFFTPREIVIDAAAKAARLFVTTTGHSQVGEFVPSRRTVIFRADKDAGASTGQRFENTLWKDDCYLNPNRPQFGTWKFSRAGWAPGDLVRPWWIDLSDHIRPGRTAVLRYEPRPYDFGDDPDPPAQKEIDKASHVVRAYLISYRAPGETMPAPTLQVTGVAEGSNAAKAGVKRGDYLAVYDGQPLNSLDDLRGAIQSAAEAGKTTIAVVVYRGTARVELELGPGKMGVNLAAR